MELPHIEKLYKIKRKVVSHLNERFRGKNYMLNVEVRKSEPPATSMFDIGFSTPAMLINGQVICRLIDGVDVAFTYMYLNNRMIGIVDTALRHTGVIGYTMPRGKLEKNYLTEAKSLSSISVKNAKRRKLHKALKHFCHHKGHVLEVVDFYPSKHDVHYDVLRIRSSEEFHMLKHELGESFRPAYMYTNTKDGTFYMYYHRTDDFNQLCIDMCMHDKLMDDSDMVAVFAAVFDINAYGDKYQDALMKFINKYG